MEMCGLSVQMKPGGNAGLCTAVTLSRAVPGVQPVPSHPPIPSTPGVSHSAHRSAPPAPACLRCTTCPARAAASIFMYQLVYEGSVNIRLAFAAAFSVAFGQVWSGARGRTAARSSPGVRGEHRFAPSLSPARVPLRHPTGEALAGLWAKRWCHSALLFAVQKLSPGTNSGGRSFLWALNSQITFPLHPGVSRG